MTTNNNGHRLDSAGNVGVDFVWGNFPLQPNDERAASVSNTGGSSGDHQWSATTKVASARLTFPDISVTVANALTKKVPADNHAVAETGYSNYPAYTPAAGNYIVTAASGDGTTVTYTAQNKYLGGETVNITGLSTSAFNLSSATVATANANSFTVTNSAGSGVSITGQYGKVEITTAASATDGAYIAGVPYVKVPSVLGLTTALAQDALADAELTVTTAAGATNTAKSITRINVTTTSVATVYATGADTAYPVGTKVSIGSGTGIPTALVGTWTVTGGTSGNIVISGSGWTVADTGSISPSASLTGTTGTIKTQSVAAIAASIAINAAITITPWA